VVVGRTQVLVLGRRTLTLVVGRTQVLIISRKAAERETEIALRKLNNIELHILHYLLECDAV
jgi:hypothetical protein